ncbi:hypothetical protein P3T20_005110 [Paraburkholderia sp. GAS206C]|uniref:hypothetical protein n=1 Tax=unclassified Paraburkholderia TaxID=2615204 RepID=UPI003D1C30D9
MSRADYEADICSRLHEARVIPFRKVDMGEGLPAVANCHSNVDAWVKTHPECKAVRGWVTYIDYGDQGIELTAHSVVQDPDNELFDITPLERESTRASMRFIRHSGDDESFSTQRHQNLFITCSCSGEAEK